MTDPHQHRDGTAKQPVLEVRNLDVSLVGAGQTRVVRDLSVTVNPGETVCVVGESGSGKSVTAFSIMGLLSSEALRCTSGSILLQGENVLQASPDRLRDLRATTMAMVSRSR